MNNEYSGDFFKILDRWHYRCFCNGYIYTDVDPLWCACPGCNRRINGKNWGEEIPEHPVFEKDQAIIVKWLLWKITHKK